MRSLRTKLFINVGFILIIVAVLNDLLPEFRIRKKVDEMSVFLNQHIDGLEDNIRKFSSFFILYNLIQGAVNLDGMTVLLHETNLKQYDPWEILGQIVSYNPQVALLRLQEGEGLDLKLRVQDVPLYSPQVQPFLKESFFVQIPNHPLYIAVPSESGFYLLFDQNVLNAVEENALRVLPQPLQKELLEAKGNLPQAPEGSWTSLQGSDPTFSEAISAEELWKVLFWNESKWLEKIGVIQEMCLWQKQGFTLPLGGILKMDADNHKGLAILANELIISAPGGPTLNPGELTLDILNYGSTPDLQLLKKVTVETQIPGEVSIGFSISAIIKKMATLSKKPIIITWMGAPLGYTETGEYFDPAIEGFPFREEKHEGFSFITWRKEKYVPHEIAIKDVHITLLTPEAQALSTERFLSGLKNQLSVTLTFSLLGATLISFGIALSLLHRTARKITAPIVLLSHAAEELGSGKYEGLKLPQEKSETEEVSLLIDSFQKMVTALKDRDKIRGVLNKAVSKQVSEELLNHPIELGGEEKEVTMLFSDIRNFTRSAEHLNPQILIGHLNSYLTRMCRVIDETKGVVDKFVGDEIMALYGVPIPLENAPILAIKAALQMLEELKKWNQEAKTDAPHFEVGIGIHTGKVCVGNMGAENRQNYTVIGANVNLAARLCAYAKPMQILISQETCQAFNVSKTFKIKPLEPATLKGIDHPVPIFEVLGLL